MPGYNTKAIYMRKTVSQAFNKIWEYPLTLVEAPMGYGKTTAVKEYLKGCEAEVFWQTLVDDSVSVFWHDFSQLFKKIDSNCADSLAQLGVPNNSIFMTEALELIGNVTFPPSTVMVIDDYHLLLSDNVDRFIELLVKAAPKNLHIVIISRVLFGENTTELVLKGYCHVIDKSCFEFTKDEIIAYYKLCGVKLNLKEAAKLYDYTEGWISALYLCMLDLLQEGRIEQQASLYELIEKVVYRYCSAEVKEFLLNICIFDSFSLAQAKAMWHKENTEAILKYLLAKNAFIKYDKFNKIYQMHNIFTSYLRDILARQETKKQQAVLLAAGEWYVSTNEYLNAMNYFYQAGDFDKLLTVFELDKGRSINNEYKEKLIMYFEVCPEECKREHIRACLIYAECLNAFNARELFSQQCNKVRIYIDGCKHLSTADKEQLSGELEVLYGFANFNDIKEMAIHLRKAWDMLKSPSHIIDKNGCWTFGTPSMIYLFHHQSGKLLAEVDEIIECVPYFYKITDGYGSGAEYVIQAEYYYYIGDFEKAEVIMYQAMYMAQSKKQMGIILCTLYLQARLALVKGDLSFIQNFWKQIHADIKNTRQYIFIHTTNMCEGFIYAWLHQEKKIPAWIAAGLFQESRLFFPSQGFFNIIYGKALLLKGDYLKLLGNAERFIAVADGYSNLLGHIYTYIYVAIAYCKMNNSSKAKSALRKALEIAVPDRMIMPFVENGEEIIDILAELGKEQQYAGFASCVRKIYTPVSKNIKNMRAKLEDRDNITLTAREAEIAALVVNGLSNRVIAETLDIAEITVKKTLHNMYAKLKVNNRTALTKLLIEKKTS